MFLGQLVGVEARIHRMPPCCQRNAGYVVVAQRSGQEVCRCGIGMNSCQIAAMVTALSATSNAVSAIFPPCQRLLLPLRSTALVALSADARQRVGAGRHEPLRRAGFEKMTVDDRRSSGVGRRTLPLLPIQRRRRFPRARGAAGGGRDRLEAADPEEDPLLVVSRTAEMVLDMHWRSPRSAQRSSDSAGASLRDKESPASTSTSGCCPLFAPALAEEPSGDLGSRSGGGGRAHHVRQWLKSGGRANARQMLRDALRMVRRALSASWQSAEEGDNAVVAVVRTAAPAETVLKHIQQALRDAQTSTLGAELVFVQIFLSLLLFQF